MFYVVGAFVWVSVSNKYELVAMRNVQWKNFNVNRNAGTRSRSRQLDSLQLLQCQLSCFRVASSPPLSLLNALPARRSQWISPFSKMIIFPNELKL